MKRAARFKIGSVVLDKRRKTWNLLRWENGERHSQKIGTVSQFPTKASAWRAAKPLRDAVEKQTQGNAVRPPCRVSTRGGRNRPAETPQRQRPARTDNARVGNSG